MADINIQKHLDGQRAFITDLYVNYKYLISEIHRELAQYKEPWFSENQLRYAIKRWGLAKSATANPSAADNVPSAVAFNRHVSAPTRPKPQSTRNQAQQPACQSDPTQGMRTGAIGVAGTMATTFDNTPTLMFTNFADSNPTLLNMDDTTNSARPVTELSGQNPNVQPVNADYISVNQPQYQEGSTYGDSKADDKCTSCGEVGCFFC